MTRDSSTERWKTALNCAGLAALAGAVMHVAIAIGGPDWYAFFRAPAGLVAMAQAGHPRAMVSALVIAGILLVWALYAFSGSGHLRRLPLLRPVLALIGSVLLLRGALMIPLTLWKPWLLARLCSCDRIDAFIVLTSLLCLAMGAAFTIGAIGVSRGHHPAAAAP
jgi:putative oxidoreductase